MKDRFIDNGDGTISDHKTGLMWQKSGDGKRRDWAEANQYGEELVFGGYSDWRLPSIDELFSIIDYSRYGPAIDPVFDCRSYDYWSSSTCVDYPLDAWLVGFYSGLVGANFKTSYNAFVRCVRGGP
jgi:hypothetical protein